MEERPRVLQEDKKRRLDTARHAAFKDRIRG